MTPKSEQFEFWNGERGQRWAVKDAVMERLLAPIGRAIIEFADPQQGEKVLDVGCGCGNQTVQLAQRLGPRGRVTGIDISQPMLSVAYDRLAQHNRNRADVELIHADAAHYDYANAEFDLLFSRFGIMFFDDPVAAFSHLRNALRTGGRLTFCCWQGLEHNDFMRLPLQSALRHVPAPEPAAPDAPGPFAFGNRERVATILTDAGFNQLEIEPAEHVLSFGMDYSREQTASMMLEMGPVSALIAEADEMTRTAVYDSIVEDLAGHDGPGGVCLGGRTWMVRARVD